ATGGYGNVFYLSTNAMGCNVTAAWRAVNRGAFMANPCYTQIHPTCIPVSGSYQSKLTLMSESLRNDGRVWVPRKKEDVEAIRKKNQITQCHTGGGPGLLSGTTVSGLWKPGAQGRSQPGSQA